MTLKEDQQCITTEFQQVTPIQLLVRKGSVYHMSDRLDLCGNVLLGFDLLRRELHLGQEGQIVAVEARHLLLPLGGGLADTAYYCGWLSQVAGTLGGNDNGGYQPREVSQMRGGDRKSEVLPSLAGINRELLINLKQAFDPAGILNPGRMYREF